MDSPATLSDELLKSAETSERATVEAVGRVVMALEDALPRELAGTSEVVKTITELGLQMTDRLIHTGYDLMRDVVGSAADSLPRHDGARPAATSVICHDRRRVERGLSVVARRRPSRLRRRPPEDRQGEEPVMHSRVGIWISMGGLHPSVTVALRRSVDARLERRRWALDGG